MTEESLLRHVLATRFTAGVHVDWDGLLRFLRDPHFPDRERTFKGELADAIREHRITPAEFERITSIDQDSQSDVDSFLVEEVWRQLYPDEAVPA